MADSLKASSRSAFPALQAGSRCSDSQEIAGAVGAAARGAFEAGERGGGAAASRFIRESGRGRGQGHSMGPCSFFHKAKAVGEGAPYAPESCGAGVCGGSAVGRRT
jgi:hypothetical protein